MQKINIFLGSDHAGYMLKEQIIEFLNARDEYRLEDLGCKSEASCDYPLFADKVAQSVANEENSFGILCCYTGIGMSMKANRLSNVRAALCHDKETAMLTRKHNDANILCLGALHMQNMNVEEIVLAFLKTNFSDEIRHAKRVNMLYTS